MNFVNYIRNPHISFLALDRRHRQKMRGPMETRKRSLVKAIIWNAIGLISMSLVGLMATGSMAVSGMMAVINVVIGFTCYLVYERVWAQVRWGRNV